MVVVVSIVLILVTLVLPGLNSLWNQRKLADAENSITGMLMTARAKAMQSGAEGGLFFFVDDRNVQRVVSIVQDPAYFFVYDDSGGVVVATAPDPTKTNVQPRRPNAWEQVVIQNVFVVTPDRGFEMPVPMRVVPRFVINSNTSGANDTNTFIDPELASNNWLVAAGDQINRHRNFFSVIYSPTGELVVGRNVLIAENDEDKNTLGDITGLQVGVPTSVSQYYAQGAATPTTPLNPPNNLNPYASSGRNGPSPITIQYLVADGNSVALNFPSVDGLMVYDDALFNGISDPAAKRTYLMNSGQPFYIHRLTGAVVRGPLGKNVP